MRLLIYALNYEPELVGAGKYTSEMAAWLSAKGHEVRVVTALPYYPEWRLHAGYSRWRFRKELSKGVQVWRCPLWVPRSPHPVSRLLHLCSFAVSSSVLLLRQIPWRPELLIMVEPTLLGAPVIKLVARLCSADSWLHVQDIEFDAALGLDMLPRSAPLLHAVLRRVERRLLTGFTLVSSISGPMLARLEGKGVRREKMILLPNWVDLDAVRPLPDATRPRKRFGIPEDAVVALSSGSMGAKQGLEIVIEAARILQSERGIRFVLSGDGPAKGAIMDLAREYRLSNVQFLPLQPAEVFNELLNCADVHLLTERPGVSDSVMPSRIVGMLASGRPVICSSRLDGAIARLVIEGGVGTIVTPGDADALASAILELGTNAERRELMGRNARSVAESAFGKDTVLLLVESAIERIRAKALQEAGSTHGAR